MLFLWQNTLFIANNNYTGHFFLHLKGPGGKTVLPTYLHGGNWLPHVRGDPKLCARLFTRCILNHAPIGSFRQWFFSRQYDMSCECRQQLETHKHILNKCLLYKRVWTNQEHFKVETIMGLIKFLDDNPKAFTFIDKQQLIRDQEWDQVIIH
ncbi:hypothetical protein P691DRAFT_688352 [Macrolepiota fuliginosa MF-IS2]|uniref:Uncharacterized protein n=1 Tax=Macrolepiota fuliginosa MF-IS2 TaxID=1400762 RepID=A0A9P5WWG8_9AGAR|nr:hypothetical protein P691DRAFT_688352 [Macrolepiota fuliginosa MF-IS2]